jgi:hypothetical protein
MEERRQSSIRKLVSPPPAADRLLIMAWAFLSSQMLLCAEELGLFAELARDPADLSTLSECTGIDEDTTARFLTALVGLGLIEQQGGMYCNTEDVNLYLDRGKPSYIGGLLALARTAMQDTLSSTESVEGPSRDASPSSLLAEQVWSDIDSILRNTPLE